jgi:hypothetical protein
MIRIGDIVEIIKSGNGILSSNVGKRGRITEINWDRSVLGPNDIPIPTPYRVTCEAFDIFCNATELRKVH